ncbi:MAG TPA: photosystem II biogenesis protein Psp29 [Cyanobacteria bacterium UBA11149]|nr:photosystem II biogenesis protein Psp29 [Cyanobacteria bacterium UBA11367]HBE56901.1 photosystem II biogenesis protein Psp29 [Cyanobacteria bacterium UBA11366]HBK64577.1 photosystem II biogenesis protein Psp29 [Cyanobacteria bacterium UBA11166]HBR75924.1 photosystem II biogenesis protein Psp29 [Cyanobacteria bacterium UBA11159]HBS69692.1 photosystem II biogenesis protein Psp29 [Cyanobacteria bacterium UBA11153]HBW92179.1 photosystem II biogenesis protein Psp29 [Cyanobacteria bacterium UBA11
MSNVRTVSDTKRDFYSHHTRPINSIYRRVVEELMVEMHLLSVNVDFEYDPIYALGVVTSFNRFMEGYKPEADKQSIFAALCQAVGGSCQGYKEDGEKILLIARRLSGNEIISWLSRPTSIERSLDLPNTLSAIAENPKFKYSRLFAIGLFTLLEEADSELVRNQKQLNEVLQEISQSLNLPQEKVQKDLELYRSNLEKMAQVQSAMADIVQADRKKREQRLQDKNQPETSAPDDMISDRKVRG